MAFLWNGASHAARHDFLGVGMTAPDEIVAAKQNSGLSWGAFVEAAK